ncbi:MAG: OmpH family outer membrane protein [Alphaproteobacteria bacterium]
MFFSRKTVRSGAIAALGLIALAFPQIAEASSVLVVDSTRLWQETTAGKDAQRQVREFGEKYGAQLKTATEDLKKKADEALKKQKADDKQKEAAYKQIEQKVARQFQRVIRAANSSALSQFYEAVRPVLLEVMRDKKGDLLVEKSSALFNSDKVEVTNDAIQRIEIKVPKIEIKLTETAQADGEAQGPAPKKK